jgi:membrane-bound lytic murein transglycosylase A
MTSTQRPGRVGLQRIGAAALLLAMAGAVPALARNPLKLPGTQYEPTTWAQVDGWADDDHDAAFATFLQSCKAILQGEEKQRDNQPMFGALSRVCQKAVTAEPEKPGEAQAFFEQNFRPVRISPLGSTDGDGFITGYYEPIVEGLRAKAEGYDYPFYRKPGSLLPGGHMAVAGAPESAAADSGKDKKKKHRPHRKLVSYYDRAAIDAGALAGRNLEICWLKDPIDTFFAQIQGSVRVRLDDGQVMRLNYDAANGQPYYAVGRWLIDRGIVLKEEMSMDRIREWMERNPKDAEELRRRNKSYVFFRETHLPSDQEPIGAEGISLTPGRSIAVDHRLHTYGTPFFISAYLPIEGLKPDTWFKRLMIAQDTGGAIVGPARADLYFGAGNEAESIAGRLRHYGKFVMLAPRELVPRTDDDIPLPRPRPPDLMSDATPADTPTATIEAKPEVPKTAVKPEPRPKTVSKPESKPAVKPAAVEKKIASAPATTRPSVKIETAAEKKSDKLADDKKAPAKHTAKSEKSAPKSNKPVRSIHDPQT